MIFLFLLIVIIVVIVLGIKIIPQSEAKVIERLGAYNNTLQTGVHYVFPIIDRVAATVSLKKRLKILLLNLLLLKIMLPCK